MKGRSVPRRWVLVGTLAASLAVPILVSSFAGADTLLCIEINNPTDPAPPCAGGAGNVGIAICGGTGGTAPADGTPSVNPLGDNTIHVNKDVQGTPVWVDGEGNIIAQTGHFVVGAGGTHAGFATNQPGGVETCP